MIYLFNLFSQIFLIKFTHIILKLFIFVFYYIKINSIQVKKTCIHCFTSLYYILMEFKVSFLETDSKRKIETIRIIEQFIGLFDQILAIRCSIQMIVNNGQIIKYLGLKVNRTLCLVYGLLKCLFILLQILNRYLFILILKK